VRLRIDRKSRHPWIFKKMVQPSRSPAGSVVRITDRGGRPAGTGFYNPNSEITVRVLDDGAAPVTIDAAWIRSRIAVARELRTEWLRLPEQGNAWRLLNAEGDGCSGLVVDHYADQLLVHCYALGWWMLRDAVTEALQAEFPGHTVVWRTDPRAAKREGFPEIPVRAGRCTVTEGGLEYDVDLAGGHKTGFFCDQRENRAAFGALAAGRAVLDGCCYTGGFALNAARGGAKSVDAVDLDETALAVARANAARNGLEAAFHHADLFDHLRNCGGDRYDLAITDPAGWGKVRAEIPKALRQYTDLNRLAMLAVRPGGWLVACCCAGLITEATFVSSLKMSAAECGRRLQVVRLTGAAADHPIPLDFPEGAYLKAVWARVF
jgi:23S rRNA (cytosine1962-C5)-methyltransferase